MKKRKWKTRKIYIEKNPRRSINRKDRARNKNNDRNEIEIKEREGNREMENRDKNWNRECLDSRLRMRVKDR
jgi:hypothetical protein